MRRSCVNVFALWFLIWSACLHKGSCIKCVQCASLLHHDCADGNWKATECLPSTDYQYCIKYVGQPSGSQLPLVFRDCSTEDLDGVCRTVNENDMKMHVCYETCSEDGCNATPVYSVNLQRKMSNSDCTIQCQVNVYTTLITIIIHTCQIQLW